MTQNSDSDVQVRQADRQFEITVDGKLAGKTQFFEQDGKRVFFHTEVDDAYAGRGLAAVLVRTALDETRADGLTAVPVCPYVAGFLKKNEQEYDGAFRAVRPADLEHVQERRRS